MFLCNMLLLFNEQIQTKCESKQIEIRKMNSQSFVKKLLLKKTKKLRRKKYFFLMFYNSKHVL